MDTHGGSISVWMASANILQFPTLTGDVDTDVCVIGAGIGGLTCAYLLAREGRAVTLIDAMEIGAGASGRTAAHFFPPDARYFELAHAFGAHSARLVADSFHQATGLVESIIQKESIDCAFERLDGYLFSLTRDDDILVREAQAARNAGEIVAMVERVPGLSFDSGPCLRFSNQAQFHPLKYLSGLARAFIANGGRIFTQTRATGVIGDSTMRVVETPAGKIHAKAVVIATNTPFNDRLVMHTKQAGYRTYVIGLRVPKDSVPRVLMWDTGDPYYYIRLATPDERADHEILIVGGADHKVGQEVHPEHRYDALERWTREHYPMSGVLAFKWSGEVMEPADGVAFLGCNPMDSGNVYIITGDSGNGMTHCTAGAMLITDLIMGRANPWAAVYDPSRKPVHGVTEFVKQQANTLGQYRDWLTRGDVEAALREAHRRLTFDIA